MQAAGEGRPTAGMRDGEWILQFPSLRTLLSALPPGFKCPICSKSVASDEMEMHFIMCLSKPRLSYNGKDQAAQRTHCPPGLGWHWAGGRHCRLHGQAAQLGLPEGCAPVGWCSSQPCSALLPRHGSASLFVPLEPFGTQPPPHVTECCGQRDPSWLGILPAVGYTCPPGLVLGRVVAFLPSSLAVKLTGLSTAPASPIILVLTRYSVVLFGSPILAASTEVAVGSSPSKE